jgi:hypothetical protein
MPTEVSVAKEALVVELCRIRELTSKVLATCAGGHESGRSS